MSSSRLGHTCPTTYNPADFFISTLAVDPEREKECRAFVHSTCDTFVNSSDGQAVQRAVADNMQGGINGNGGLGYQNGKVSAGRVDFGHSSVATHRYEGSVEHSEEMSEKLHNNQNHHREY